MEKSSLGLTDEMSACVTSCVDLGDNETMLCIDPDRVCEYREALLKQGMTEKRHFCVGSTVGTFYEGCGTSSVYVYENSGVPFARAVYGAKLASDDNFVGKEIYDDTIFYQVYNDPDTASGMT